MLTELYISVDRMAAEQLLAQEQSNRAQLVVIAGWHPKKGIRKFYMTATWNNSQVFVAAVIVPWSASDIILIIIESKKCPVRIVIDALMGRF